MKKICILSSRYPTEQTPTNHVFVQQLVWSLADLGIECHVISPTPRLFNEKLRNIAKIQKELTNKNSEISLYFPTYISFGQRKVIGLSLARITTFFYYLSVKKVINKHKLDFDAIYGHFITPAGIVSSKIGKKLMIPSFLAYGESTTWSIDNYGIEKVRQELSNLNGVISVSSYNKKVLLDKNIIAKEKVEVFVNAIRTEHFYPRDKIEARKKFKFKEDDYIVAYVGQFSERKGVKRVSEAINNIKGVSIAYAGKGPLQPDDCNTIFCNTIDPEDMPWYLSAADVFVLPTLNEGCCNAILEAMACGLPIISSDLPFNYDILDESNSILINPNSISEIRDAITLLRDNLDLRKEMSENSLKKATHFSYENRARNILEFIKSNI